MRNFLYIATFFVITPVTLVIALFALQTITVTPRSKHATNTTISKISPIYSLRIYAANSRSAGEVLGITTSADARIEIIRAYLKKYNSPLLGEEETLVAASDKYGLDFRLLVAIAQQESNLCKIIPRESFNCWGWGIHSRGSMRFKNYKEAIETVAKGLREDYINKGYTTPELIMKKYTPLSPGSWAMGVRQFMAEME